MYYLKNMVVVSHKGFFIHLYLAFLRLFHDVMILCHSNFYKHWRAHFIHGNGYFEYLLGDPSCIGKNIFIMQRLGDAERPPDMLIAHDKMHVNDGVRVEWGTWWFKVQI